MNPDVGFSEVHTWIFSAKCKNFNKLSGYSEFIPDSLLPRPFKSLCCFGGWWVCGTFASPRCCVWPWPRTRAPPPPPAPGLSASVSDLPPPPRHRPWSLRTLLYQTGTGRPRSDGCRPSSSHSSRLPALGRRSRSGTPEGGRDQDQDQPARRVFKTSFLLALRSPRAAGTPPWCDAPPAPWLWLFCPLVDCSVGATGRSWRTPAFRSRTAAGAPGQRARQRRSWYKSLCCANSAVNDGGFQQTAEKSATVDSVSWSITVKMKETMSSKKKEQVLSFKLKK